MFDDFGEYIIKVRYKSEYKNVYIKRDDLTDVDTFLNYGKFFCCYHCYSSLLSFVVNNVHNFIYLQFLKIENNGKQL